MSDKRSQTVKKRQKTLQRRRQQQPTSKQRLLTQIPPERADVVVQDPKSLLQTLKDMASSIPGDRDRMAAVMPYMDDKAKQPVPAIERFPLNYYEEGICFIEAFLAPHQVIAMHHWRGNTDYIRYDMIQGMLRDSVIPAGETDTMSLTEPSADSSLAAQLRSLMQSDDSKDWLQAWELIRDHLPENVTTFGALDALYDLNAHDCSVTDMFYELEMELHNEGLEDARLTAKRAELARWVYIHFTEESMLTLGNFRSYEAQSLWDIDQRDKVESLFQELIGLGSPWREGNGS